MATKNAALANKEATDWAALWNSGFIRIYTAGGSGGGGTLLAEIPMEATAFDVTGAVATARGADGTNPISTTNFLEDTSADASGTAAVAELHNAAGTYLITGLTVGTSGTQIVLDSTAITAAQQVKLTNVQYTVTTTVS